jgi:hypothetical protein
MDAEVVKSGNAIYLESIARTLISETWESAKEKLPKVAKQNDR